MIGILFRIFWRILIGVVAIILAYATAFLLVPYLDRHFPLVIVIAILYILIAYFGIPSMIRLWQLVFPPKHLPHYAVSADGWSSDPINIAIVAKNRRALMRAMKKSGWHVADKVTPRTFVKFIAATIFSQSYPTAPFSKLYLLGRPQDIGFQIQSGTPPSPRHRHHVRFWLLTPAKRHDTMFWHGILRLFMRNQKQIWIGAATHDVNVFGLRKQNLQMTHRIDADTNKERDFLVKSLQKSNFVRRKDIIPAGNPIAFKGQTFGVDIVTDGTLTVIEIKNRLLLSQIDTVAERY